MTSPATHVTPRETREQALTLVQATITPACSRAEEYPIPDDRADFAPLAIKAEENSLFELLPGFSTLILQALIDASKFSAIPGLDQVASAALSIVQTIQDAKSNKRAFRALGEHVCEVTYVIVGGLQHQGRDNKVHKTKDQLRDDLLIFLDKLNGIKEAIKVKLKQGWFSRLINASDDKVALQQLEVDLRHSLDLFGVKSHIELRQLVSALSRINQEFITTMQHQQGRPPSQVQLYGALLQPPTVVVSKSFSTTTNNDTVASDNAQVNNAPAKMNVNLAGATGKISITNVDGDYHTSNRIVNYVHAGNYGNMRRIADADNHGRYRW
ncbi:hypothetical protein AX16_008265 [Volvariella volvacea WC 439]|nr:hypothetical protein AX16_008265 [Volvariella volvacea WC 439]